MKQEKPNEIIYLPKWIYLTIIAFSCFILAPLIIEVILTKSFAPLGGGLIIAVLVVIFLFWIKQCYKLAYMYGASKGWAIWMSILGGGGWLLIYWYYIMIRYKHFRNIHPEEVDI